MRFDLVDLKLLVHVVEAGSITAGARRANLALASASARIAAMETALGCSLFERRRRGVAITPAGRLVVDHARLILERVDRMRADLAAFAKGVRANLRILANTAAAAEFLPDPLADFLNANPFIDVDLSVLPSARVFELVAAGRADLGVAADQVSEAGLTVHPFRTDQLVAILPGEHRFAGAPAIAFEQILDSRFVALPPTEALQIFLEGQARQLGRHLDARVRMGDFSGICRLVMQGVGVAVVPTSVAARYEVPPPQIVALANGWSRRQLVLCHRAVPAQSAVARLVTHLLGNGRDGGS